MLELAWLVDAEAADHIVSLSKHAWGQSSESILDAEVPQLEPELFFTSFDPVDDKVQTCRVHLVTPTFH